MTVGDPRGGAAGAGARRRRGQPGARGGGDRRRRGARRRPRRAARSSRRRATASRTPTRRGRRPSRCPGRRPRPGRPARPRPASSWSAASASSTRDGARAQHARWSSAPDGLLARYRKLHLWGRETELFTTGDERAARGRHARGPHRHRHLLRPLVPRARARAGPGRRGDPRRSRATSRTRRPRTGCRTSTSSPPLATAHVNRVHLVVADRCGTERGHRWLGAALVVDADGTLLRAAARRRPAGAPRSPRSTSPRPATSAGARGTTCSPTGGPGCTGRAVS